ncbi:MAG: hypothetical protein V5A43_08530, partial [Haloarculaceae archaeon]
MTATANSPKALGPLAGVVAFDGTATSLKALGPLAAASSLRSSALAAHRLTSFAERTSSLEP